MRFELRNRHGGEPFKQIEKVIIPVNSTPESDYAAQFSRSNLPDTRYKFVNVIEVKRSLPLDADLIEEARRGEEILGKQERLSHGFKWDKGDLLQARSVGDAIVDEAEEMEVDAIIMGAKGNGELSETVSRVLKHSKKMVIIVRAPLEK